MTGFASTEPVRRDEPHWYLVHCSECPACGRGETHRTRMPGKPPEDGSERYVYEQIYDHCVY